ncbi:hypothetical protein BDZ94DRAFT_1271131 [Collybia nuda]|uniref:Uncharacterized protein n=1 Tax=Collybia nuda TaxID=64659 RepID=A0A9P5XYY0_9AGAR|nr:hypothetical protein BDZ94DRAFT_1271131 [Collybia nuda]
MADHELPPLGKMMISPLFRLVDRDTVAFIPLLNFKYPACGKYCGWIISAEYGPRYRPRPYREIGGLPHKPCRSVRHYSDKNEGTDEILPPSACSMSQTPTVLKQKVQIAFDLYQSPLNGIDFLAHEILLPWMQRSRHVEKLIIPKLDDPRSLVYGIM